MSTRSNAMSRRSRFLIHQVFVVGFTLIGAIIVIVPIAWMLNASIRPIKEVLVYPPKVWSENFTLQYFGALIANEQYRSFFRNSVILSLAVLILTVTLGLLAAYGFSRFKMKGGNILLLGIMALLMLPPVTLIIPYFRLAHLLNTYDTLFGLILVDTAFILPICTWLLKGYIDSIPVALEEAAMIDGCTRLQTLQKILLPLLVPGLIGTGTFVFIFAWNEYLLAVALTESTASQPLTIGLAAFFGQYVRDWNSIMALNTLTSIPLMIIFVIFQRWVVQGMTSGAVK